MPELRPHGYRIGDPVYPHPPLYGSHSHATATKLEDGRMLYVFVQNYGRRSHNMHGDIMQSRTTLDELLTTGGVPHAELIKSGVEYASAAVFWCGGRLMLHLTYYEDLPDDQRRVTVELLVSPSGDGSDWTHHQTLYQGEYSTDDYTGIRLQTRAGIAYEMETGRILLTTSAPFFSSTIGIHGRHFALWTSTDGGESFSEMFTLAYGIIGGPYGWDISTNITRFKDHLYFTHSGDYGGAGTRFYRSEVSDGTSWEYMGEVSAAADDWTNPFRVTLDADEDYLYYIGSTYGYYDNQIVVKAISESDIARYFPFNGGGRISLPVEVRNTYRMSPDEYSAHRPSPSLYHLDEHRTLLMGASGIVYLTPLREDDPPLRFRHRDDHLLGHGPRVESARNTPTTRQRSNRFAGSYF